MTASTVSVVIPVYNGEHHLRAALRSVSAQTHRDLEVIVVDDGSTDSSASIAEATGARVLRRENGGMSSARNLGIASCGGAYVAFLDHDDLWEPLKTEAQLRLLEDRPEAAFALCHMRFLFEGDIPGWFRGATDGSSVPGYIPSTWLVPRATLDAVGLFDPSLSHGADTDWLARARDMGLAEAMADGSLVQYRIHGANATSNVDAIHSNIKSVLRASLARKRAQI